MSIPNEKERVRQAIREKKIINDTTLKVFLMLEEMKEKIDKNGVGISVDGISLIKGDKGDKGDKGEKGDSIRGPQGEKGDKPVVGIDYPYPKDGKTPLVDTSTIALRASMLAIDKLLPSIPTIEQIEQDLPKLGEPIRDSLELLKDDERLNASAIKGLGKMHKDTLDRAVSILDQRSQFLINKVSNVSTTATSASSTVTALIASLLVAPEDLTAQCDGANLVFTTTNSIQAILWVSVSGGMIFEDIDFTITGDKEITLSTFAPMAGEQLIIKYI